MTHQRLHNFTWLYSYTSNNDIQRSQIPKPSFRRHICVFFSFMLDFQGVYLWNRFGNGNSLYLRCLHLEPRMTHWAICNDLTSTYSSNSGNQSRNLQRINSSQKRFMGGTVIPLVPILASLECENFRHCILGINYGQWMASHHCEGCMPKIHPSMVFLREASRKKKHKNQHMFVSNRCFPQQFFNDFLTKICQSQSLKTNLRETNSFFPSWMSSQRNVLPPSLRARRPGIEISTEARVISRVVATQSFFIQGISKF